MLIPTHLRRFQSLAWCAGATVSVMLLSCLAPVAMAAEDDENEPDFDSLDFGLDQQTRMNDWRLGYGLMPTSAKISLMDGSNAANSANYRKDTSWDKTGRTGVMWMTPWGGSLDESGGFLLGLEVTRNHGIKSAKDSSPGIDAVAYALTLHPGIGWAFDRHLHIEVNPFIGVGLAQVKQDGYAGSSGLYYEAGLRTAAYYTFKSRFQIGLQVAYMMNQSKGSIAANGGSLDVDVQSTGLTLGLQFGYRLK